MQLCPSRTPSNSCCWHKTGSEDNRCCWCGALKSILYVLKPQQGHGTFAPRTYQRVDE